MSRRKSSARKTRLQERMETCRTRVRAAARFSKTHFAPSWTNENTSVFARLTYILFSLALIASVNLKAHAQTNSADKSATSTSVEQPIQTPLVSQAVTLHE